MIKLYPSLMAADLLNIRSEIEKVAPYCDGFHIDIMDNHFVPNLTFGTDIVNAIARITTKQLWLHLMLDNPEIFIDQCTLPINSIISFHFEIEKDIKMIVKKIIEKKCIPSIALKPKTNAEDIVPLLNIIGQVLIMSVEPGHYGQPFLESAITILDRLTHYRKTNNLTFRIGMDGGIQQKNIGTLARKGVDDFALGSAVFKSTDPQQMLKSLKKVTE